MNPNKLSSPASWAHGTVPALVDVPIFANARSEGLPTRSLARWEHHIALFGPDGLDLRNFFSFIHKLNKLDASVRGSFCPVGSVRFEQFPALDPAPIIGHKFHTGDYPTHRHLFQASQPDTWTDADPDGWKPREP